MSRSAAFVALGVVVLVGLGVAWRRGFSARAPNPEANWAPPASAAELERWYKTLADDHRPYREWIDAAELITRPRDEIHVQGERAEEVYSVREVGMAKAPALGELLRARKPPVSDLIERRITTTYASADSHEQRSAISLAKVLARWDAQAAKRAYAVLAAELPRKFSAERPDYRTYWVALALEIAAERDNLGDRAALGEATRWAAALNPADVGAGGIFRFMAERRQRPEVAALSRSWFDAKRSDLPVFSDVMPLMGVTRDYALVLPGLRDYVVARLDDRSDHGAIEVGADGSVVRRSGDLQGGYQLAPGVAPAKDGKFPLRVCDQYAIDLSGIQGAPPFDAWAAESARDAQIDALRRWLKAQPH